jgi:FMN reductase
MGLTARSLVTRSTLTLSLIGKTCLHGARGRWGRNCLVGGYVMVRVVGLGGSLRAGSTSRTALEVALEGAAASGADVELIWVRDLALPLYTAEHAPPARAHELADAVHRSDAMIWSSPTYHGSVSGAFKNALDWLILLAERTPPYLSNKPIGLVCTAGGVQGLQAVNSMDYIARALRGWSVPLVLPVGQSWQSFDEAGRLVDEGVAGQLRALGAEVVRAARQFRAEGTCDYADDRQFSAATATT